MGPPSERPALPAPFQPHLLTCNSCSRDRPPLANRSQAKLAAVGPGMSSRVLTACRSLPSGGAAALSAHLSIHLTRGKALRTDSRSACCTILLTKIMERWCLFADPLGVDAHFVFPAAGCIYNAQGASGTQSEKDVNFLIIDQSWV